MQPDLPDLDYPSWRAQTRSQRVRTMVVHWADKGFGTPDAVYLLYILKIAGYIAAAIFFVVLTPGVGGLAGIGRWWAEPIVFEKFVLWNLLFEVLGLGCGFGPLTLRFLPPLGSFLYWLRPGTIRLPPWPATMPGTRGTTRTMLDVVLYAGVLAAAVSALLAPGSRGLGGLPGQVGLISPARLWPLIILLPLLGLRDKAIFLAARPEVYGTLVLVLLLPGTDMIATAKLFLLLLWWGAATSKLNRHFPFVVSVMMANNPLWRVKALKRRLFESYPDDMRPSGLSRALAHGGTVVEFTVPLLLVLSRGGIVTAVAATIMVLFHLNILTSIPLGVPLEWNVFMIFGVLFLFVHYASVGPMAISHPLPAAALLALVVGLIIAGNLFPERISFLPAMRYYAGNWDTSVWCLTEAAVAKIEARVKKASALPAAQLARLYDERTTDLLLHKGIAFRAMHSHGRALYGLVPRLCGPSHETAYAPTEGEVIAGMALGWNFGDGHLHNAQLISALQERCRFDEGELRVVVVHAQPMLRQRQHYQLIDAATGVFEEGHVAVADMLARQPWTPDIPVTVPAPAPAAPAAAATAAEQGLAEP
ncbi:MAG: DUF3556 domain-containing protein [Nocardiopsaceae bacterium]|jgi:hypothetical protein|nr:DUF3556 domain-containing protein [Nocardiopsaceae bacterium]